MLEAVACDAEDAAQRWAFDDVSGTLTTAGPASPPPAGQGSEGSGGGGAAARLCLRYFAEARSFASWMCGGVAEERFAVAAAATASNAAVFCTGVGAARACVAVAE